MQVDGAKRHKKSRKQPDVATLSKKNAKKRKRSLNALNREVKEGASKAGQAAQKLLDDFGLCPISMQPMRRPVLPSSGQAYDEISLVRYCRSGKKSCPVSGTDLKFHKKGAVQCTVDYALRKFINTHAGIAGVFVPSTDKESLMREVTDGTFRPEAAKAIVDDCYLGYIKIGELRSVLKTLASTDTCLDEVSPEHLTCRAIVAECFACRNLDLCNLAVEYMNASTDLWKDKQVLQEAMAVGQDPECRGEVLLVLESKVARRSYTIAEIKTMLDFESENVPVQQFQCQTAETFIFHCIRTMNKGNMDKDWVPVINKALRVREDLDGVGHGTGLGTIDDVWRAALLALKKVHGELDEACLQRLFWRDNFMVLQYLAQSYLDLLVWHLKKHEGALSLCLQTIADQHFINPAGIAAEMYSSEEDEDQYLSEEDDAHDIATYVRNAQHRHGISEYYSSLNGGGL